MHSQSKIETTHAPSAFGPAITPSNLTRWLTRFLLAAPTVIFTRIAWEGLFSPAAHLAARGLSLTSALGVTTARVGLGAFPLAVALVLLSCLVSARRQLAGLYFLIIVDGMAIMVRVMGTVLDGPVPQSVHLFVPESVILVLGLLAIYLQWRDRGRAEAIS